MHHQSLNYEVPLTYPLGSQTIDETSYPVSHPVKPLIYSLYTPRGSGDGPSLYFQNCCHATPGEDAVEEIRSDVTIRLSDRNRGGSPTPLALIS